VLSFSVCLYLSLFLFPSFPYIRRGKRRSTRRTRKRKKKEVAVAVVGSEQMKVAATATTAVHHQMEMKTAEGVSLQERRSR
jgi:hypothetical protein